MKRAVLLLLTGLMAIPVSLAQEPSAAPAQEPQTVKPQRIRIGGAVLQANLLHQVLPVYPEVAKTAHIEGTVILHVIIAQDGTVQNVTYISGPPMLLRTAMDAVRQWVYKPTLLNGEPVEVDSTVSVVFTLDASSPESSPPEPIDPEFRADILHLLEVTHAMDKAQQAARSAFDTMRPTLARSLPDTPNRDKIVTAYEDKMAALFQKPEFTEAAVLIYAKYLSDDDVRAMTNFYATPAGQHAIEHLSEITGDSMRLGQKMAADNVADILHALCKEFPELEGQAKFCPPSGQDTSKLIPGTTSAPLQEARE